MCGICAFLDGAVPAAEIAEGDNLLLSVENGSVDKLNETLAEAVEIGLSTIETTVGEAGESETPFTLKGKADELQQVALALAATGFPATFAVQTA